MQRKWVILAIFGLTGSNCTEQAATTQSERRTEGKEMVEQSLHGVEFRFIETNGIRMRIAEAGTDGPLVLFAHGWPESWYSWRHQIPALAAAGYRVVVPEMRGYGQTDAPENIDAYNVVELAADMVGILDAVGVDKAIIVGHDWGAPVATHSVLLHPTLFFGSGDDERSLWGPRRPFTHGGNASKLRRQFFLHPLPQRTGGVAESEYDGDPRGLLSRLYLSPDSPREDPTIHDPKRAAGGWIPRLGAPKGLPEWLSQEDLDYYVKQFEHSGFRGGVNYYRNIERNWEVTAHLADAVIDVPTLFLAGERDMVIAGASAANLRSRIGRGVTDLRDIVLIPGIGHWVQQEAPDETNRALLDFLDHL
ncbi:MAG: epoxide hydrolase [Gammaproteobacteria bacterium]|nr:MAG: epoxide hydrolase [Gammaproteobacteria bacterium]